MGRAWLATTGLSLSLFVGGGLQRASAEGHEDFCRDFWAPMGVEDKQRFESEADAKTAVKAPEGERRGLLTCLEADRPDLTQRLDALCASGTSSPDSVVAALKHHVMACVGRSSVAQAPSSPSQDVATTRGADASDRLGRLEGEVAALKKRIDRLENPRSDGRPASAPSSAGWKDRGSWRRLRAGMSPVEVEGVLGQPRSVMKNEYWTSWYYLEDHSHGEVEFTTGMKVKGWTEP